MLSKKIRRNSCGSIPHPTAADGIGQPMYADLISLSSMISLYFCRLPLVNKTCCEVWIVVFAYVGINVRRLGYAEQKWFHFFESAFRLA
jgi:hypothetical protein